MELIRAQHLVWLFFLTLINSTDVSVTQGESDDLILLVRISQKSSEPEETPDLVYLVRASPQGPPRIPRGMDHATTPQPRVTLFDLVFASMRKPKEQNPPTLLVPPPEEPQEPPESDAEHPEMENPPEHEEDPPEAPQLPRLFTNLANFLAQPLKIPKKTSEGSPAEKEVVKHPIQMDRDGRYDLGMVATMPFKRCPPGLRQDAMGNCRPMFRNRRGYNMRKFRLREIIQQQNTQGTQ